MLIGDPALKAYERRKEYPGCEWFDLAGGVGGRWTGLPWVAAVWAVRPEAVTDVAELVRDLNLSRQHGMMQTEALVTGVGAADRAFGGGDSGVPDAEYSLLAG